MAVDYGRNGYIGTCLCDGDGVFSVYPVVTLDFSQSYLDLIPGITITWSETYGEWATRYRITAYHGERAVFVGEKSDGNDTTTVLFGDIAGFDRIVIEVKEWCRPYRRARIEKILLGVVRTYTKSEIISYEASMFVDPLSASLPKSEITFKLVNLNGEYNPDSLKSQEKYLMERQEVTTRYGYKLGDKTEWIPGGVYYLSEWETPQNGITATFTARDALEFLNDTYTGPFHGTLMEIAESAMEQANLPLMADGSRMWSIHSSLDRILSPYQEGDEASENTTIAEILQMCANAACCVFYQDRSGKLRIEKLDTSFTDYKIDRFNSYSNSEISLSKQLRGVDVNNGQYTLRVGKKGEIQPVSNDMISDLQAPLVAAWTVDYLENRRTYTGDFRADPRLDPLDLIRNENMYAEMPVLVTTVKYTYNGAFRGSYEGHGMENAMAVYLYAGQDIAISGLTFEQAGE